ncbi:coproporphyrinogen III oxidase, partial [Marivivens sp.]|uniref:coproporphyrinogen III oxidase n=1 Tax=Marivivens sp. TaxID=1978374 RepID=UPI0025BB9006
ASVAPSDAKAFTKAVALSWLDVWEPIAKKKRNTAITEQESIWHQQRRGRYLEFNLLYDTTA